MKKYFIKLANDHDTPEEDRIKIKRLLEKRWNPYVRRHSALTEQSSKLPSEHVLRQFAGWSPHSQMHLKYIHLSGDEAKSAILKEKGIVTDDRRLSNRMQPKQCPTCNEPNSESARLCYNCSTVLTYEGLKEIKAEQEKRENEIQQLKEQVAKMQESQLKIIELLNNPAMVQHIRANPSDVLAAADAADKDTANYIASQKR